MKINEVTEGFFGNVLKQTGKNLAKQAMGQQAYDSTFNTDAAARNYRDYDTGDRPDRGSVFVIKNKGRTYFKTHTGEWFEQPATTPDVFDISRQPLTGAQTLDLDKLVRAANKKDITVGLQQGNRPNVFQPTPQDDGNLPPGDLSSEFKIVHQNPTVVQYGSKKYTRDSQGNWVFFGSKRQVSSAEEAILDKVAPLQTTAPTAAPRKQKPITVKDNAGVIWSYNDTDQHWYDPEGEAVTDPEAIKKLNNRAQVQFQNRQMSR